MRKLDPMHPPRLRSFFLAAILFAFSGASACDNGGDGDDADGLQQPGEDVFHPMDDAEAPSDDALPGVDTAGPGLDAVGPGPDTAGPGQETVGPDTVVPPPSPAVDPECTDGQYDEVLPFPNISLAALEGSYSPAAYLAFIDAVLDARYPVGAFIVSQALARSDVGHCVDMFLGDKSSGAAVIGQLSTIVHECGHLLDWAEGGFYDSAYVLTPDLSFTCSDGMSTEQYGLTFARSLIKGDQFSQALPPCEGGSYSGCDSYANIYLDGAPNDGDFQGGDQGFNSVLEETTQYVNSLAVGYAFHDHYTWNVSERDGILTFLWYLERYLHMARTGYPGAWNLLSGDPCWREAILTVWGRAFLYLELTKDHPKLGINDAVLLDLVMDPLLLDGIQQLRDAAGCP
ncbi:MAG: hypothetical protein ABIK09_21230 [Pseudomonadota bacterium]